MAEGDEVGEVLYPCRAYRETRDGAVPIVVVVVQRGGCVRMKAE